MTRRRSAERRSRSITGACGGRLGERCVGVPEHRGRLQRTDASSRVIMLDRLLALEESANDRPIRQFAAARAARREVPRERIARRADAR